MLTRFFVDGRQLELYPNAKFGIQSRGRSQAQQQGLVPGAGVGGSGGIKSCRCCCLLDCFGAGTCPASFSSQPPTTASYKRDKSQQLTDTEQSDDDFNLNIATQSSRERTCCCYELACAWWHAWPGFEVTHIYVLRIIIEHVTPGELPPLLIQIHWEHFYEFDVWQEFLCYDRGVSNTAILPPGGLGHEWTQTIQHAERCHLWFFAWWRGSPRWMEGIVVSIRIIPCPSSYAVLMRTLLHKSYHHSFHCKPLSGLTIGR